MYLDTNDVSQIKEYYQSGAVRGITTNPTILSKGTKSRFKQLEDLLALNLPELFVQVLGETAEEMVEDYLKIKDFDTDIQLSIKVPVTVEGLKAVKKIKKKDEARIILGTLIYSADQGILASIAGCDFLAPYVNRMLNQNIDPYGAIKAMRAFIDDRQLETKITAASFKNSTQVVDSINAGAHIATIPVDIFKNMLDKELALNALTVFEKDGADLFEKFGE